MATRLRPLNIVRRTLANPIVTKELRSRMRGNRGVVILSVYLTALTMVILFLYATFIGSGDIGFSVADRQSFGKAVFAVTFGLQLFLIAILTPAMTAGSIAGERERQTYDLLRTTTLSARSMVLGKLGTAVAFVGLLILATLPLQSVVFFIGGVSPVELLLSVLILLVTALMFSAFGVLLSCLTKRVISATILSYTVIMFIIVILPIMLLIGVASGTGTIFSGVNTPPDVVLTILLFAFWGIVATNPAAASVASEIILIDQQSYWWTTLDLPSGATIGLPSPWLIYVPFAILLSAILITIATSLVRRKER